MKAFSLCNQHRTPSLVKGKVVSSISEVCTFLELTIIRHIIGNSLFPGTLNLFSFCQFSYRKLSPKLEQHSGSHVRESYKGDKSGIEQKIYFKTVSSDLSRKSKKIIFLLKELHINKKCTHLLFKVFALFVILHTFEPALQDITRKRFL